MDQVFAERVAKVGVVAVEQSRFDYYAPHLAAAIGSQGGWWGGIRR